MMGPGQATWEEAMEAFKGILASHLQFLNCAVKVVEN